MRQHTTNLYIFDELSEKGKQKAIEEYRYINTDFVWYDYTIDDCIEIGLILGIQIDRVYFRGFCSQGDGACFQGSYNYAKGAYKRVIKEYPDCKELHAIAKDLQDIQKRYFYGLTAKTKHRGYYSHSGCMDIDTDINSDSYQSIHTIDRADLAQYLRDFADWIYSQLEREYEYLTSDEMIIETIETNELEFDESYTQE